MGKTVLITGCSSGIGKATAERLAGEGWKVYAGVRKKADLDKLRVGNVQPVMLDVTWDEKRLKKILADIVEKEGSLDVLVNNAGYAVYGSVMDTNDQELREQFETNFFGAVKLMKLACEVMRGRGGKIINIGSIAGTFTSRRHGNYCASKRAMEGISEALRLEENDRGVWVSTLNPGGFRTNFRRNKRIVVKDKNQLTDPKLREAVGGEVEIVAKKISQIVNSSKPRRSYVVGMDAWAIYWAVKLLPVGVVDWLVRRFMR
jgi:NAD(P)-dependent dehydrogenase (short-subunit alcohol dehydrogenase family)